MDSKKSTSHEHGGTQDAALFFRNTPRNPRLLAEAVASTGLHRRSLIAAACACCTATMFKSIRVAAADVAAAPSRPIHAQLDTAAQAIESKMLGWRRDIHQNPELGTRRTALPAWSPSTCAHWATRSGKRSPLPGSSLCYVAVLGPARSSPYGPTWMHCRSRSRRVCRLFRGPARPGTTKMCP